jgi:hypothetical protein
MFRVLVKDFDGSIQWNEGFSIVTRQMPVALATHFLCEHAVLGRHAAGEHHSRSLCRTPDEANAEDEHADCQHHCANIGQIDEPVRGLSVRRQDGQEKGSRHQDCGDGDRTRTIHFIAFERLASST